ncbi:MAG: EamA family transporter [Oscillospiraceae bacterium]|nr:EamA family transporter [Oscillospiraceae bacterium]
MTNPVWLLFVLFALLMWAATSLLYKVGAKNFEGGKEEHICLKFSVCVGMVFFVIALAYLVMREEPFTIWESAVKYWPMTLFGIAYAIVNTISYKGYVYNEATVESPVEGIAGGTSTVLLILAYLVLGRVDSISKLLTPLRTAGILVILVCVVLLAMVRNRESGVGTRSQKAKWMRRGLGTLVFPVVFAIIDGLETIVTGICLDTTYGFSMPEGDSIIIVGMEYALFALAFWIYIYWKEKKPYNPFARRSAPRIFGALADNVGIVFYSYAMAMNSVSTDPLLALYPIFVMVGGRVILKEKVSKQQYVYLLGIIAGSVMVIADTVF